MVSSDTMVGIIGAVVLFVALAGVFIYEANNAPGLGSEGAGQVFASDASGEQGYTAGMAGAPPAIPATPAVYSLELRLGGLPPVAANELYIAVFVVAGGGNHFTDVMTRVGMNYTLNYREENPSFQTASGVIVTLETSSSPAQPGMQLLRGNFSGNSVTLSANVTLAGDAMADVSVSGGTASGTLTALPARTTSFQYRVWLVNETATGTTYSPVQNISMPNASSEPFDAEVSGMATPPPNGFTGLLVTLEKSQSTRATPGGWPIFDIDLTG